MAVYLKIDVHGKEKLHPILWKLFFFFIAKKFDEKGKDVHVTSIGEDVHMIGSLHYAGKAIDFLREGFIKRDIRVWINEFCDIYGDKLKIKSMDFDLLEYPDKNIFHLELDPK